MSLITGIVLFVIPLLITVGILSIFGAIQWRKKSKLSPTQNPMFRPIGPDTTSGYTQSAPTMPLSGATPGFKHIGPDKSLVGICFLTGELVASCRCDDCDKKRRSIYTI
jgi:hypothetical protein